MSNIQEVLRTAKKIHFIGIGGSGMCPLAEILHAKGYSLQGSDNNESSIVDRIRALGIPVSREQIIDGVSRVRWPGRLEWHENLLIDGAHNPPAVHALGQYVHEYLKCRPILLTSVMADKDTQALAEEVSAFVSDAVTVSLPEVRAMPDTEWAEILKQHGIRAMAGGSAQEGLETALRLADGGPVLVAGSFYLAGAVRSAAGLEP